MLNKVLGHDIIKRELLEISKNLPKVSLFCGPSGVGKKHTAFNFIDEIYGGTFSGRLTSHPDICFFEPDTKVFKIEYVHQIQEKVNLTPIELDKRFFILKNVDKMNAESANACLKILEDSPKNVYFILLAENKNNVLKTILSRSVIFNFYPITNLKENFPEMSELEIDLLQGCPGSISSIKELNVEEIYKSIEVFLDNFEKYRYSDILLWFSKVGIDLNFLIVFLYFVSLKKIKERDSSKKYFSFIKHLNLFKEKVSMSLNLDMHFKNMLIQIKQETESS